MYTKLDALVDFAVATLELAAALFLGCIGVILLYAVFG